MTSFFSFSFFSCSIQIKIYIQNISAIHSKSKRILAAFLNTQFNVHDWGVK